MSEGRVELGIGTGWYGREHDAFGLEFPTTRRRFDRLEEVLAVLTGLWSTETGAVPGFSFGGEHFRIDDNRTPPRPVQLPGPPIIIGGAGPKRTPAIAARYAAEFNGALGGDLRERFAIFDRACEAIGRDPGNARHSAVLPVACGTTRADVDRRAEVIGSEFMRAHAAIGAPDHLTDRIGELAEIGADTVYLHVYDIHDLDQIALIGAEVLPHVPGAAQPETGVTS